MKKYLFVLLLAALLLSACGSRPADITKYAINIAPADTMGEWVTDWLAGLEDGGGFQYFIYSDPDSWDLYLCYPDKQVELQALTAADIRLEVLDSILQIYVSPTEPAAETREETWVIHIAAPFHGAWPTGAALYWGVTCDGVYYKA